MGRHIPIYYTRMHRNRHRFAEHDEDNGIMKYQPKDGSFYEISPGIEYRRRISTSTGMESLDLVYCLWHGLVDSPLDIRPLAGYHIVCGGYTT